MGQPLKRSRIEIPKCRQPFCRHLAVSNEMELIADATEHNAQGRAAQAGRSRGDCIEHGLSVRRGARDDRKISAVAFAIDGLA
jgi:hypothetical protein